MICKSCLFLKRRCLTSHVATIDLEVRDLSALQEACKRLGLEFVEGQKTYRWYGESVGDFPLPEHFTAEDLGKCDHAIRVPADHPAFVKGDEEMYSTYEVGVVRRRDGRPGFSLMWDFWAGGNGLKGLVGEGCNKLRQAYGTVVATRQAQRAGMRVQEFKKADGGIQLRCVR